jgi:hypothetical protein
MKVIKEPLSFDWDDGNINKNFERHLITTNMAEEPFKDRYLLTFPDPSHSKKEARYNLIGKTKDEDLLFITYTIRATKIRIISARVADKKERKFYEQQKTKKPTNI